MKKSFIRRILSVVLSCSVMTLSCAAVSLEEYNIPDTSELLEIYSQKFELLNEKYGTDFWIAPFLLTEAELDELLTGYYNMTDEEFEEYFVNMKEESDAYLKEQEERSESDIVYKQSESYSIEDLLARGDKISFSTKIVKNTEPVYAHKTDKSIMENEETEEYNTSELLEIYSQKFELLNEKYGSDLWIAPFLLTEAELDELLTGYYNMTDEEFEEYFVSMTEESEPEEFQGTYVRIACSIEEFLEIFSEKGYDVSYPYSTNPVKITAPVYAHKTDMENGEINSSPTVNETQCHFYDERDNCFCVNADVNYSGGWGVYMAICGMEAWELFR